MSSFILYTIVSLRHLNERMLINENCSPVWLSVYNVTLQHYRYIGMHGHPESVVLGRVVVAAGPRWWRRSSVASGSQSTSQRLDVIWNCLPSRRRPTSASNLKLPDLSHSVVKVGQVSPSDCGIQCYCWSRSERTSMTAKNSVGRNEEACHQNCL